MNNLKVTLVTKDKVPVAVGAGRYCFPIKDNEIVHNEDSRAGAIFVDKLKEYDEAYDLSKFAWKAQEFNSTENN